MRFRIPPLLPPYLVLVLVLAYAGGFVWLGLVRLEAIDKLTQAAALNAATVHDLQAFLNAVNDIETAGRGFALTGDPKYLEPFERGRSRVPKLLAELRDKVRDDPSELAYVEQLVPLIGERIMITATSIERKRNAPPEPYTAIFGRRGDETSEALRGIVAALDKREQDELTLVRDTLELTLRDARRDLYVMGGLTLLLLVSLFMTVRRLRSFIPPTQRSAPAAALPPAAVPRIEDGGVGTSLRDALLRARLAAASAPADSPERTRLRSLVTAMEKALAEHSAMVEEGDESAPDDKSVVRALAMLQQTYTRNDGVLVKATIDRSAKVADPQKAFLIYRSAEWALEAILHRKRAGEVGLQLAVNRQGLLLRVHALIDNTHQPAALTPKENEEANALRQGITALGGVFELGEAPTGFSLSLQLPPDP